MAETKLIRVSEWLYDAVKTLANEERRPIGSQLEMIYEEWEQYRKLLAKLEVEREAS